MPIGTGVLSYSFYSFLPSLYLAYYFFSGFTYFAVYVTVFEAYCCAYFCFFYCSSFSFFFFYYACFLFYSSFFFYYLSAVNLSKFFLQLFTILYYAFFWLAKKSVFLLRKPKTVSKNPSMLPFCWMIDMRMPSNLVSWVI